MTGRLHNLIRIMPTSEKYQPDANLHIIMVNFAAPHCKSKMLNVFTQLYFYHDWSPWQESTAVQYMSALSEAKFKIELWAYNNAYCSWLFQAAMLGRLSFGTPPPPPPMVAQRCHADFGHWTRFGGPHFRPYRGTS